MPLRSLIVDDEPGARELLAEMLAAHAEVEIVGAAPDAATAIALAGTLRPDVVFLDIQMPGGTGFEVVDALAELGPEQAGPDAPPMPFVVFVTAYDAHAVRAFEAGALDYLLKPLDDERLARTVARLAARRELHARAQTSDAPALLDALGPLDARLPPLRRLPMRVGERVQLVPVTAVTRFEADGKHVHVHLLGAQGRATSFALRRTMQSLETRLDPEQFLRVSRSAIVNVDHLQHAESWSHGEYVLVMRDGARVLTTQGFRGRIQRLLRGG